MRRYVVCALLLAAFVLLSLGPRFSASAAAGKSKLYVTNSEGDEITIIDPVTLKVTGAIKTGHGPHGIVAAPAGDRVYVTVEGTQKLLAISAANGQILGEAPLGKIPNQPALTRDGRFCYVPLRGEDAFEIVDVTEMKVVKKLPAPAWPHNMYLSADGQRLYLGSIMGEAITLIDPAAQEVIERISMGAGVRPLAIPRHGSRIFVALSKLHGFALFDVEQKQIVKQVELPPLPPGTPTPFLNTYTHGLLLADNDRELWVTSCPGNALYVFTVPELKQTARIAVGELPNWLAITPDQRRVFVSNTVSNTVTAIDARTKRVLATIPVGKAPKRLLVVTPQAAS
jgi:YVTN family beta-propeller protein